jgi:TolB protein
MKLFRSLSRRVKFVLLGIILALAAGGGFLTYRISTGGYPDQFSLFQMMSDGKEQSRITELISVTGSSPSWSPDGKKIVLESEGDIYVLDVETSRTKRLTTASEWDLFPVFSPDGEAIAFTSDRGGKTGVYLMSSDGSRQRALSLKNDNEPAWSPDGGKILFDSGRKGAPGLYVINSDGTGLRRLTRGQHYSAGEGSSDYAGSWSPDGSRIVFTSHRTGGNQVYVMNADGSDQRRLTKTEIDGEALQPAWSPDGSKIAFMSGLGNKREIYLVNSDGTGLRRLTNNREYDGSPSWSPDGSRIAFVTTRGI